MFLMNTDIPVLWFDPDSKEIQVVNNAMLPYQLIDMLRDTDECTTISEGMVNYDRLRRFFTDRTLSLSRDNAKQILQSIQNTQKLTEEERFQLSLKCRGVSVSDNFWVKYANEMLNFADVNIRNRSLSDVVYQVSMNGENLSLEHPLLAADIATRGMFRKTWMRFPDGLYLCKSDRMDDNLNTKCEIEASEILSEAHYGKHVLYKPYYHADTPNLCCICKCFTDDRYSFVEAEYIKAYCENHNINFIEYIRQNFMVDFADMVIIDYCLGNPDEHINNWGFMIDNADNTIVSLAPVFDNNMSLIIFKTHKEAEFDELIYEPTGLTMAESAQQYIAYSSVDLSNVRNLFVADRYKRLAGMMPQRLHS